MLVGTAVAALLSADAARTVAEAETETQTIREILAMTYPENETISVKFQGTPRLPRASGEAKVERKKGMTEIEIELDEMKPAALYGGDYNTYVLWVVSPESHVDNLGEFILEGNRSKLDVSTPLETFGMFITAEPHFLVKLPSRFVVMENTEPTRPRPIRIGRIKYEGFQGEYLFDRESLEGFPESKGEIRAEVESARTAVALAERADAEKFASDELKLAREALRRAEMASDMGVRGKDLMILAHESIRRSVEAQELAQKRSFDAALAAERQSREAELARLETSLTRTNDDAERARLEAEKKAMEAEMERKARQEAQARADEAFNRAQRAEEEARKATEASIEAQKERMTAEEERSRAEREALEAQQERERARAELRTALESIAEVRESARGLIVSLPDILFDSNEATLRPEGRETLAKIAGALLVTHGYELRIEGHTDSVGPESYNLDLSRHRAESVRDYLLSQGVDDRGLLAVGFGESRPIASNDSPRGRQENRRVEIVIRDASRIASESYPAR
jgi:outer membrane protein OmpA-like peptidoglycan-associated protein